MIKGNLIDLAEQGRFDVIVHGCNCFHTMGAGIAKEIATRYPLVLEVDKKYTQNGDKSKLGGYTYTGVTSPQGGYFIIINAYTQHRYGRPKNELEPLLDYGAVKSVFKLLKTEFGDKRIGYPKIGAGLAGGDWNIISTIIEQELAGSRHELVVL